MITLQSFEDHLDRWGGAVERWPPEVRREAEALLAGPDRSSGPARALLATMVEVEAALAPPAFATPERFAAVATRHPQDRPSMLRRSPMLRRAGWGAAVAAALVLGILAGDLTPNVRDDGPDQLLASALDPAAGTVDVD